MHGFKSEIENIVDTGKTQHFDIILKTVDTYEKKELLVDIFFEKRPECEVTVNIRVCNAPSIFYFFSPCVAQLCKQVRVARTYTISNILYNRQL